jgi:hypothetical protein
MALLSSTYAARPTVIVSVPSVTSEQIVFNRNIKRSCGTLDVLSEHSVFFDVQARASRVKIFCLDGRSSLLVRLFGGRTRGIQAGWLPLAAGRCRR